MNIQLSGIVQQGDGRGSTLGYPTANIRCTENIPEGIYISQTKIQNDWLPSITFIGAAVTFGKTEKRAETTILDFHKNLYGKVIFIRLLKKIRNNKKFSSAEDLKLSIAEDERITREYFASQ